VIGRAQVFEWQNDDAGQDRITRLHGGPFKQAFGREDHEEGDHGSNHDREHMRPPPADECPLRERSRRGRGLDRAERQGQVVRRGETVFGSFFEAFEDDGRER